VPPFAYVWLFCSALFARLLFVNARLALFRFAFFVYRGLRFVVRLLPVVMRTLVVIALLLLIAYGYDAGGYTRLLPFTPLLLIYPRLPVTVTLVDSGCVARCPL